MRKKGKPDDEILPVAEESFIPNGCSGGVSWFWKAVLRAPPPWEGACDSHDYAYWNGGTKTDRYEADLDLAGRIMMKGYPLTATGIFYAVRVFGRFHWTYKKDEKELLK